MTRLPKRRPPNACTAYEGVVPSQAQIARTCGRCSRTLTVGEIFHCQDCLDEILAEDEARANAPELFAEPEGWLNRCPHGHAGCCGHHDLEDMPIHTGRSEG